MEPESCSRMNNLDNAKSDSMIESPARPKVGLSDCTSYSSFLRLRPNELNDFIVYTRRKRSNSGSHLAIVSSNNEANISRGNVGVKAEVEKNLRASGFENDVGEKRPLDPLLSANAQGQHNTSNRDRQGRINNMLPNTLSSGASTNGSRPVSTKLKTSSKITKKDHKMHQLVFRDDGLPDGAYVAYYNNGKKLLEGHKMGSGIICKCCNVMKSPSQFEAHAGWGSRRKPYMHIYTSNGVSLHEFAISLLKGQRCSTKNHDNLCNICKTGGKHVLCAGCQRAFHKECVRLLSTPRGKWYCKYCQEKFKSVKFFKRNVNAIAAGRVSGVDSIKEIKNCCIQNVINQEEDELIACILCRGYDYSTSEFGPLTSILCDQCEREYHVGCLKKRKMDDLKELPKGEWFCSEDCKTIYSTLHSYLKAKAEKISNSSLNVVKKKQVENSLAADIHLDVEWRLLSGKVTSQETEILLSEAVTLFHDCFDPIVDLETGSDLIESMIYGRNIRGQDFSGMYCAILTVNSSIVSAGILRIFGKEIAELPLAATRNNFQGKGYFQILYSCIEKLLASLNVKTFVIPATEKAKSIWTEKFGFDKIPDMKLLDYRKTCWQMITFKGTSMLEKSIQKPYIVNAEQENNNVLLN